MKNIVLHYYRPPSGLEIYEQLLLLDEPDVKVSLLPRYLGPPVRVDGQAILEATAPILWFTFPELWHDIGRFHRADGTVTGLYTNILKPVTFRDDHWETTDLILDLWLPAGGAPRVLDEDKFEHALAEEWLDPETAARAREELARLLRLHTEGRWPPEIVRSFHFQPDAT